MDLQQEIEEFVNSTQIDWRIEQPHTLSGEEWLYILLGVIVLYIVGCSILHRTKKVVL